MSLGQSVQRDRAIRAALLTVIVVVGLLVVYHTALMAVSALVTSGQQPMPATDRVPVSPTDDRWSDVPTRTVTLHKQQMALPYGGGSVDKLRVQALTNETHVAFRLRWSDPTMDTNITRPEAYSDAVAVMLRGGQKPPITMGATGQPVNIWYWRASWQFGNKSTGGTMYTYPHPRNETQPGAAAGNPLSKNDYRQFAQNYYAKGYGSLSIAGAQPVVAHAERTADGWSVVFVREREPSGTYGADFASHDQMYLAFAVWNGSHDEVNGQKSITLQYSTLDTRSGRLAPPGSGNSGDGGSTNTATSASGSGENGTAGGTTTGSGPIFTDWLAILVATTVVTYTVAYWRLRE